MHGLTVPGSGTKSFDYDGAGRLTNATAPDGASLGITHQASLPVRTRSTGTHAVKDGTTTVWTGTLDGDLKAGELDECIQRAYGSDDGATLSFVDGTGVQKRTDVALYLSHGDYGAYYVIIQDHEVIVGPTYRNGLFSILRDRPFCSPNERGDASYVRIDLGD